MDPQSVFAIKYLLQVMVWTCEKSEQICKERFKKAYEDWHHTEITWEVLNRIGYFCVKVMVKEGWIDRGKQGNVHYVNSRPIKPSRLSIEMDKMDKMRMERINESNNRKRVR